MAFDHFNKTNSEFAKDTKSFKEFCKRANINPTTRQASKWRMKKGLAYKTSKGLV